MEPAKGCRMIDNLSGLSSHCLGRVMTCNSDSTAVIGRDHRECKGPVAEPHRNHRLVWKKAGREEQWTLRLETRKG